MKSFLADGNWYLHRAYSIAGTHDPKDQVAKLFVSMICKDALATRCRNLLVAFDGDRIFRYKVYKKYKSSRSNHGEGEVSDREIYTVSLPYLKTILDLLEFPWIQKREYEADDILMSTSLLDGHFVIGSKDKDIYQALKSNVQIYVGMKDPYFVTANDCKAKFGVSPKKMVMYQSLVGDAIDDIPQILKPNVAKKLCNKYRSLKDVDDAELNLILLENKARILRNRKLVKLVTTVPGIPGPLKSGIHKKWDKAPNSLVQYSQFANPKTRSLF